MDTEHQSTQKNWLENKAILKRDICDYFLSAGVPRDRLKEICAHIKQEGELLIECFGDNWEPISAKEIEAFAPRHREAVASFINRYAALHHEALEYLEAQRNYGEKSCWARDDFELEDWEASQPAGEVQVYSDHLKVYALGYTEGFAEKLPKAGKKSVGKTSSGGYEWHYPLSSLEELKQLGLPVLYAIEAPLPAAEALR